MSKLRDNTPLWEDVEGIVCDMLAVESRKRLSGGDRIKAIDAILDAVDRHLAQGGPAAREVGEWCNSCRQFVSVDDADCCLECGSEDTEERIKPRQPSDNREPQPPREMLTVSGPPDNREPVPPVPWPPCASCLGGGLNRDATNIGEKCVTCGGAGRSPGGPPTAGGGK